MTTSRHFAILATVLLAVADPVRGNATEVPESPGARFERTHPTMGTVFRFIAYAHDAGEAERAFDDAARRLDALNASLSDYVPTSEVSRLSRDSGQGHWRILSDDAWSVLSWGNVLAEQSRGAFDMTVGPLTRLWRVSRRSGKLPSPRRLEAARVATGFRFLELDPARRRGRLQRVGMRLDLGGIAKGYAVDAALESILRSGSIDTALVDGGGDLRVAGRPPGSAGWQIRIADLDPEAPENPHPLADMAVATSGDLYQSVRLGNREFSHIIDPQTGLGLEFRRSVTVLAANALTADALASALSVLPIDASKTLLSDHYPDCAARIRTRSQNDAIETVLLGATDKTKLLQSIE